MATKPDGISWEEWCHKLLSDNKAMQRGTELMDQQFQQLGQANEVAQNTISSLEAQLEASRLSNIELGKRINDAGKHELEELMRVREICKANGWVIPDPEPSPV